MSPTLVHRYAFPLRDAIEALLGDEMSDCEAWQIRVDGQQVIVDVVAPSFVPTIDEMVEHRPEAPATAPAPEPERKGGDLARRAGILCNERAFQVWVDAANPDEAKAAIYARCGVASRVDLDHEPEAAIKFRDMAADYDLWMRADV